MPIGFAQGTAFDSSRSNWSGDGPRPLDWAVWYPADDGAIEPPPSAPGWFLNEPIAFGAALRAATEPYRVVLLSHGTGGVAGGLAWLGHRLAQRGYVALAVQHHGNTGTEPYRPEGFLCLWERAPDLSRIFDDGGWRAALGGSFHDHAFVAGFSAGAYAAMLLTGAEVEYSQFEPANPKRSPIRGPREFPNLADYIPVLFDRCAIFRDSWERRRASYRDDRFKAALVLAPGRSVLGFSEASLVAIDVPVWIVAGDADRAAPVQECAGWLRRHVRGSQVEVIDSAGHYVFLPEPTAEGLRAAPDIFTDPPHVSRRAIHDRVATFATELFRRQSLHGGVWVGASAS